MTIGELARRAGVTPRTLRHYEELGLLRPERTPAGYRVYGPADLARLQQVVSLLGLGLNLKQARRVLSGGERPLRLVELQLARVDTELDRLQALRARLVRLEQSLRHGREPGRDELLSSLEVLSMMNQPDHDPILLELGTDLLPLCNPGDAPWNEGSLLLTGLRELRARLHEEGIFLPGVRVKDEPALDPRSYRLSLFQKVAGERRLEHSVEPLLGHLGEVFRQHASHLNLLR